MMDAAALTGSFAFVALLYVTLLALSVIVPGPIVAGHVLDASTRTPLRYRLNALRIVAVVWLVVAVVHRSGLLDVGLVARHSYGALLLVSNVYGLAVVAAFYLRGRVLPSTRDLGYVAPNSTSTGNTAQGQHRAELQHKELPWYYHLYVGYEFNPRAGLLDVKMWLYLYGAVLLQLIVLSCVLATRGGLTRAMATTAGLMSLFVLDYVAHEEVHLFTYDLFAEKIGFKLLWGCLVFYPFFYALPVLALVDVQADVPVPVVLLAIALFLGGWALSRGANNQKYAFKRDRDRLFMGVIPQRTIDGRVLCSGWWGLARHVNYAGEIAMATGIALPAAWATASPWPLLYPLYYVGLLLPREREDDRICEKKYGETWRKYRKMVPFRIVPFVY